MDMAERNGGALRCVLVSADLLSDCAILFGSFHVKMPSSSSSAKLSRVTLADQLPDGDVVRCVIPCDPLLEQAGRYAVMVEL